MAIMAEADHFNEVTGAFFPIDVVTFVAFEPFVFFGFSFWDVAGPAFIQIFGHGGTSFRFPPLVAFNCARCETV